MAQKEAEITQMRAKIDSAEVVKKLAVKEAVQKVEKERDEFANDVKTKELEKQNLESVLKQQFSNELQNKDAIIKYKDEEIARLIEGRRHRGGGVLQPPEPGDEGQVVPQKGSGDHEPPALGVGEGSEDPPALRMDGEHDEQDDEG